MVQVTSHILVFGLSIVCPVHSYSWVLRYQLDLQAKARIKFYVECVLYMRSRMNYIMGEYLDSLQAEYEQ